MEMVPEIRGQYQVDLRKENAREIYQVAKAVQFREYGTFHFTRVGWRIICDDAVCQQAAAYLEQTVFASFDLKEDVIFRVPMIDFCEIIGMLDGNVTCQLTYEGYGHPLYITLTDSESDYMVKAHIHTLEPEAIQDFAEQFNASDLILTAIVKPEVLKDASKCMDEGSPTITIYARPRKEQEFVTKISFISNGSIGKITTSFTSGSTLVERMEVPKMVNCKYNARFLKRMQNALAVATRIAIRIDSNGILCMQYLLERQEQEEILIEFYCLPYSQEDI